MQISRIAIRVAALLGLTLALSLSFATSAHAQEGDCDPSQEGVAGFEGYDGYDGCDETAAPPSTPSPTPTDPGGLGGALPQTGGMTMLAAAGVVGAIGLTIRRLATS